MSFELFKRIILKHWKLQTSKVAIANFYFIYENKTNTILTLNILFTEKGFPESWHTGNKNRNVFDEFVYH